MQGVTAPSRLAPVAAALAVLLLACPEGGGAGTSAAPRVPVAPPAPPPAEPAQPQAEAPPAPAPSLRPDRLALGAAHACLLGEDGEVACWGSHRFGQLGDPTLPTGPGASRPEPASVPGLDGVEALAAGSWHTCALDHRAQVRCWGHGGHRQLGQGDRGDHAEPRTIDGIEGVVQLAAGDGHTCALRTDGSVWCWGAGLLGQLGDGRRDDRARPAPVPGVEHGLELVAGRAHTCVRQADEAIRCWGLGVDGQLGDGSRGRHGGVEPSPVAIDVDEPLESLSAGAVHTCGLAPGSAVRCWGSDDSGQLGTGDGGSPSDASASPVVAMGAVAADVVEIAAGGRHTCVRTRSERVACAGFNHYGQVGDGTTDLRVVPVFVEGLSAVAELAAGARHSCALRTDGSVWCWGRNVHGQLGDGTTDDRTRPVEVGVRPE